MRRNRNCIEITWEAQDGYAGGKRPQYSELDPQEFDHDLTDQEIVAQIEEIVSEDFQNRVSWSMDGEEVKSAVAQIRAAHKAAAES